MGLTTLEPGPDKQFKYLDLIDIYATLEDNERAECQRDYPGEAKAGADLPNAFARRLAARYAPRGGLSAGTTAYT